MGRPSISEGPQGQLAMHGDFLVGHPDNIGYLEQKVGKDADLSRVKTSLA
jgi:hypothetical protein